MIHRDKKIKLLLLVLMAYAAYTIIESCYFERSGCPARLFSFRLVKKTETAASPVALESKAKEVLAIGRSHRSKCIPKKNIVFLKTHKTGSSTVTNILNRYGHQNNLTFVLPRLGVNRLDWPWYFQNDSFFPLNGSTPNILCNHARYNGEAMTELMPNDTLYVTILREPRAHFESTFSYMMFDKMLGMRPSQDPIEEFFKDPQTVLMNYVLTQDLKINSERLKLIRNSMFYDLGLATEDFENFGKIKEAIEEIEARFEFVMITEYFDESLVLLKRFMCWSLQDIAYFRMNQRLQKFKRNLTEVTEEKVYRWNAADVALYRHFKAKFEDILMAMGKEFWDEVTEFQRLNVAIEDACLDRNKDSQAVELAADTKKLKLRSRLPKSMASICRSMIRDEVAYLKMLRDIQMARAHNAGDQSTDLLKSIHRTIIEPVMSYFYL